VLEKPVGRLEVREVPRGPPEEEPGLHPLAVAHAVSVLPDQVHRPAYVLIPQERQQAGRVDDHVQLPDLLRQVERLDNMVFAGPSVALVWDNALYGYMGPIMGSRYRIGVGHYFGDVQVTDVTLDYRRYFNLGGQWTLATRLSTYSRTGPNESEFRTVTSRSSLRC